MWRYVPGEGGEEAVTLERLHAVRAGPLSTRANLAIAAAEMGRDARDFAALGGQARGRGIERRNTDDSEIAAGDSFIQFCTYR